jgi:sulfite reductase beta subunit-like hemoprotein
MDARFTIDVDSARHLVRLTLGGFFLPADVERFRIARDGAHRQLRCAPNQHVTIADISAMNIQGQDSVMAFAGVIGQPESRSRRIAFVVGRSLATKQLQRIVTGDSARFFSDIAEALAWVLDERGARAA